MSEDRVAHGSRSLKETLGETKDVAELPVDLSRSFSEDVKLAGEVLTLEDRMDVLRIQARTNLATAGRSPDEAHERPEADPDRSEPDDLGRAVESVVPVKNTSELAVDRAYGRGPFDSEALAGR